MKCRRSSSASNIHVSFLVRSGDRENRASNAPVLTNDAREIDPLRRLRLTARWLSIHVLAAAVAMVAVTSPVEAASPAPGNGHVTVRIKSLDPFAPAKPLLFVCDRSSGGTDAYIEVSSRDDCRSKSVQELRAS